MSHVADVQETNDGIRRWRPCCTCGWTGDPWHGPMGEPIAWAKSEQHVADAGGDA